MDPLPVPYTCSRLPTLCNYVSLLQDRFKVTLHYGGVIILPTADANVLLYRISQNKWFERGWLYAQKLNRKGEKGFCCLRLRFWANEIWKWQYNCNNIILNWRKLIICEKKRRIECGIEISWKIYMKLWKIYLLEKIKIEWLA